MSEISFYYCDECDYLVEILENGEGIKLECCNKPMRKLEANTTDASQEKHVPVISINDGVLYTKVGSIEHPMNEEHYIKTIYVVTDTGMVHREDLNPNDQPEMTINIENATKVTVYAYCNQHGLWKTEADI